MKLALAGSLIKMIKTCGHPPLGLAYIASYLRKYGGFDDIVIIDKEDTMKGVMRERPDVVGFSLHSIEVKDGIELAKQIKSELDIPIIVGGAHFTFLPKTLPKQFDIAAMGEGEQTVLELMQSYEKCGGFETEELKKIKGIAFRHKNSIKVNERRPLIPDLDKLPFPARDLLDMEHFYLKPRRIFRGFVRKGTHMITSRGCPYRCVFCCSTNFWQKTRFHSAEYVVNEIKELIETYKVEAITIYDDLFVADRKRVEKIVNLMKQEGLQDEAIFCCTGRANLMDDKLCKLLKEMGVVNMMFGLESGSQKILSYLKKDTVTVEQNKRAVRIAKKYGFFVEGSFMIGSPNETKEDMMKTLDFIKQNPLDYAAFYITTPHIGTELWDHAKSHGMVSEDMDYSKENLHPTENFEQNIFINKKVTKEEFSEIVREFGEVCDRINFGSINLKYRDVLSPDLWKRIITEPIQGWLYFKHLLKGRVKFVK